MNETCPVTAIIPACVRSAELLRCLDAIKKCNPKPEEILVYVDGGSLPIVNAVSQKHPDVRVLVGKDFLGPGGARNKLVEAAGNELVANFDDDSFPDQSDYFKRVVVGFQIFPEMAVLSAASQPSEKALPGYTRIGIFSGCGCVFSKRWFLRTTGHVPLRVAYCMEEVDLSLRLHNIGGWIVHDPGLHVCHLKSEEPHFSADSNARVLANTALMPFLRYPLILVPLGGLNVIRRLIFLLQQGCIEGIWRGLVLIPCYFLKYRGYREPVSLSAILSWFKLRRSPALLSMPQANHQVLQ